MNNKIIDKFLNFIEKELVPPIKKDFTWLSKSIAKDLDLNLSQRPGELTNEMFYKITMKYEKLFS